MVDPSCAVNSCIIPQITPLLARRSIYIYIYIYIHLYVFKSFYNRDMLTSPELHNLSLAALA